MYDVNYHRPSSLEDAVKVLKGAGEAKILAGGQTLLPTMKQHLAAPSDLVDIRKIPGMVGVKVEGGAIVIGAATTHAEVAGNADVLKHVPALSCLAAGIGDPAVRHAGTIGGSIANNDPAADYPSAILALNATVVTNTREIAADDFFAGMFATALEDGEIITAVRITPPKLAGYEKFPNPASRYAMVGVFVADTGSGVRVAVTGAGEDGVFRHEGLEAALGSDFSPGAVDGVEVSSDGLLSDIHGDAAYRAHLIKVMAKRAVSSAA
ncbi:xanthine dehydrogenase family protein subunit M [Ostreiculturibacter nitratireducens]|uniref:FAD binding domain-containing protein n=1 Tax=Ostreiculturibacter nitratireducens TaxID=3075226 RepID=UPI0031B5D49A